MYHVFILMIIVCTAIILSLKLQYTEDFETKQKNINIYVINMDRNQDRYGIIMHLANKHMPNTIIKRFSAVDGSQMSYEELGKFATPEIIDGIKSIDATNKRTKDEQLTKGMIGCYMSHISLYKENLKRQNDVVIILEDDANFNIDLVKFVNELREFPIDWDILLLGHVGIFEEEPYSTLWKRVYNFWGLQGYIINKKGMEKMIQNAYPISKQIDHKMGELAKANLLKIYAYKDILVSQNGTYTTVQMNISM